jgi:hypothetical protein
MGDSVIEVLRSPTACGAPAVWSAHGRTTVLSCIGCGRIDAAQQCAGTCGEHRMEIVAAAAHDRAVARLGAERRRADALRPVIDRLAAEGVVDDWESAYRRLQAQARDVLRDVAAAAPADGAAERLAVWSCGGCGRVEAEAPCVGVCTDERLEVVRADVHDEVHAEQERIGSRVHQMDALVRQLAFVTPRANGWKASVRALRDRARELSARPAC